MKWVIVFFCITPTNPDCMRLDKKIWGLTSGDPFRYNDEESCVSQAEGLAEDFYNTKRFELEYNCHEVKWEPYVPHRRQ